jgi:hypothetical protein
MTMHVEWREIVRSYPCPQCEAAPGEPCVTAVRLAPKHEPHASRSRLASSRHWHAAEDEDEGP